MTKISIVIPLFNEEESISELAQWIDKVLKKNNLSYEEVNKLHKDIKNISIKYKCNGYDINKSLTRVIDIK